jgi:hypothetical protein
MPGDNRKREKEREKKDKEQERHRHLQEQREEKRQEVEGNATPRVRGRPQNGRSSDFGAVSIYARAFI